jgi:beta-galactosidase
MEKNRMEPIRIEKTCYGVGGQSMYLNSGEFHYFRVPPKDWRRRMKLLKDAGGNCLGTYVPWAIHEPEEGRFAFDADAHTRLERFLETASAMGLYVVARPGPYQYSELLYAGLPGWLCDTYPAILARKHDGTPMRYFSVSYVHPVFLDKARRWFDKICPILARYTVSRGGPIAMTQIDNEMIGIHVWFGGLDYNPEAMGYGRADGRYPRFLRERYGDAATMNRATGTNFAGFADAMPPPPTGPDTPQEIRRRKDYLEFYLSTVGEYTGVVAGWLREHGIDTPLVHNSASPCLHGMFREVVDGAGGDLLLGADHYYTLGQDWPQNNPTPQYARRIFLSMEALRLMDVPPTIFELPGGSASDWPPITEQDARACYFANLALGMKGHNYYIFTGGPNPPGAGSTADLYDYGASIGASGERRPLFRAQKAFGVFVRERAWLGEAEAEFDCRIALDREMDRSEHYLKGRGTFAFGPTEALDFLQKGPLTTAFCAGLAPVCCDLDRDDWAQDTDTPLIVASSSVMSRAKQERLAAFLRRGGKALFCPVLPDVDDRFEPCTVLREVLGCLGVTRDCGSVPVRLTVGDVVNIYNTGELFLSDAAPDGASVVGRDERSGRVAAWHTRVAGGGEAILLGFRWAHAMREHERMLRDLLAALGLRRRIECNNPNVWVTLRTAGSRSMLFAMNLLSAPQEAAIRCRPSWSSDFIDVGRLRLPAMTVRCVELP